MLTGHMKKWDACHVNDEDVSKFQRLARLVCAGKLDNYDTRNASDYEIYKMQCLTDLMLADHT